MTNNDKHGTGKLFLIGLSNKRAILRTQTSLLPATPAAIKPGVWGAQRPGQKRATSHKGRLCGVRNEVRERNGSWAKPQAERSARIK